VEYPYALVISSFRKFMNGIPGRGIPSVVDRNHLAQTGLNSANDAPIVSILEFIGLIDKAGKPTKDYEDFRIASKQKQVMTKCLKTAYSDLFALYSDAPARSNEELAEFFKTTTKSGAQVVTKMAATFKILCEFSDMAQGPKAAAQRKPSRVSQVRPMKTAGGRGVSVKGATKPSRTETHGWTVNVNIQLTLPESKDPSVYEELFKALKRHLLE